MVATPSTMLPLGTKAPEFTLTDAASGGAVSLSDIEGQQGTLVMFICNHCPFVIHVRGDFEKIASEYGPRGVLDETHVHFFTRATFRREVEKAGFFILQERVTALPFEVVFESTGRSRLVRSLGNLYHALARLWPTMFAYQHIIEAEITTLDGEGTGAIADVPGSSET